MSRLSREKKREQQHPGRPAAVVAPLDVHVRGGGTATIGGVPVVAVDGEEIQRAVLSHLHRIALATGHPVLATVHDERIGYVVPLRVEPDGSSHFTAEPLRTPAVAATAAVTTATAAATAGTATAVREELAPAPEALAPAPEAPAPAPEAPAPIPEAHSPLEDEQPPAQPRHDKPTHFLRPVSEPVRDTAPTFPLRAVPEPEREPEAKPEPRDDVPALGTVSAPTGVFGPPPRMDEQPNPDTTPTSTPISTPIPLPLPLPLPTPASAPTPAAPTPFVPDEVISDSVSAAEADLKPTPARGFDAVAEAVLGDDPRALHGDGGVPALLGEPVAQINEAVRAGRIDAAAGLAERTVLEASGTLGPEHPEVLRLRELTAYIAYLAGDPLRAFHVSLDLARIRHRARDAEAAYGNVQSAAAAWRAVRDPLQGLNLGTELLGLWTELSTEEGPAADDVEQLESARARMLRLAERARKAGA
ncbi:tetratricopeptide repeat protein [Streptomyces sp. NPDC020951]|uniref:tetratricopeptide repeat protein n=1 Tax=Streptomyces sp. NPDC020951 TaxID=3365104 RepID=UPI0037BE1BB8